MASLVSVGTKSQNPNVKELVNDCAIVHNYTSFLRGNLPSNVSVFFNETKETSKLMSRNLCPNEMNLKIALNNCHKTQIVSCEFNSVQIICLDNKEIGLKGNIFLNTTATEKFKRFNFIISLTKWPPSTFKSVDCILMKTELSTTATPTNSTITATASSTSPPETTASSTSSSKTTVSSTSPPKIEAGSTVPPKTASGSTAPTNGTRTPLIIPEKKNSKSSNGKIALVILAIFILMGVGIIACYFKYRRKLSNRPAYYNDISLNDPLQAEIKFYKADGEDGEDNAEEDDDDMLPLI